MKISLLGQDDWLKNFSSSCPDCTTLDDVKRWYPDLSELSNLPIFKTIPDALQKKIIDAI